ncbi:MAG: hypothetical protein MI748_00630 [Opitutales bacterium]|nr:hypothetical protein [Opitutales bacterium]
MFFLRQIGKFLRGETSSFQITSACLIAALLAFLPTPNGIGSLVILLALLLVLNANIFVAGLGYILFKLLYFPMRGITFSVGEFFIDGPTEGIFRLLINAPVTAWMGFDYYVMVGGLPFAIALGFGSGFLLSRSIDTFKSKMANIEKNKDWFDKGWVKVLAWVFFGGLKGKKTYEEMAESKKANPIRWPGLIIAALGLGGFIITFTFFDEKILTAAMKKGLEMTNGATVEVESVSMDLADNSLTLKGFAMADPNNLSEDLLRAREITADISGLDLLKRRVGIDLVKVSGAFAMVPRETPGKKIGGSKKEREITEEDLEKGIGVVSEVIENWDVWKARLEQAKVWLERLQSARKKVRGMNPKKLLKEQIRQRADELGHAAVSADHLIEDSPRWLVRKIVVEELESDDIPGDFINIVLENVSTEPHLVDGAPRVSLVNNIESLALDIAMGAISGEQTQNLIKGFLGDIPVESIIENVKEEGGFPIKDGVLGLTIDGAFDLENLDLPVSIQLAEALIEVPELGETTIDFLKSQDLIRLKGSLSNPGFEINQEALQKLWVDAGKGAATSLVKDKAAEFLNNELGGGGSEIVDGLSGLLGGGDQSKSDDRSKDEEKSSDGDEVGELLNSLFGG